MQPSTPSISRTFPSSQTEPLSALNSVWTGQDSLQDRAHSGGIMGAGGRGCSGVSPSGQEGSGEVEHQGERTGVHAASRVDGAWRPACGLRDGGPAARARTPGLGPGANLRKTNTFLPPPSCPCSVLARAWGFPLPLLYTGPFLWHRLLCPCPPWTPLQGQVPTGLGVRF